MVRVIKLEADPALLNSSFEGYKLSSTPPSTFKFNLPTTALLFGNTPSDKLLTELQVLAYQLHLNSLFHNPFNSNEVFYFDQEHGLWHLVLDEEEIIEQVIEGTEEYTKCSSSLPSAVCLESSLLAILRGNNQFIEIVNCDEGSIVAQISLSEDLFNNSLNSRLMDSLYLKEVNTCYISICSIVKVDKRSTFFIHSLKINTLDWQIMEIKSFESTSRPLHVKLEPDGIIIGGNTVFKCVKSGNKPVDYSNEFDKGEYLIEEEEDSDDKGKQAAEYQIYSLILCKFKHSDGTCEWQTLPATFLGPYCDSGSLTFTSVVVSRADDALAFNISYPNSLPTHINSFDAMAYIQSGKQDRKYSIFLPNHAIIVESSKHVFIYEKCKEKFAKKSIQHLIDLGTNETIGGWAILGQANNNRLLLLSPDNLYQIRLGK